MRVPYSVAGAEAAILGGALGIDAPDAVFRVVRVEWTGGLSVDLAKGADGFVVEFTAEAEGGVALYVFDGLAGVAEGLDAVVFGGNGICRVQALPGGAVLLTIDGEAPAERVETGDLEAFVAGVEEIEDLRAERRLQAAEPAPKIFRVVETVDFTTLIPSGPTLLFIGADGEFAWAPAWE